MGSARSRGVGSQPNREESGQRRFEMQKVSRTQLLTAPPPTTRLTASTAALTEPVFRQTLQGSVIEGDFNTKAVPAAAGRGIETPSDRLPFAAEIQRSFGRHDISRVTAHLGPEAADSAAAMNASAYATGEHVVFGERPDLRTAAHEAAHTIQQRGGVHLSGGIGRANDPYEQHAEAVADRVAAGQSAEALLDPFAGSSPEMAGNPIQFALLKGAVSQGKPNQLKAKKWKKTTITPTVTFEVGDKEFKDREHLKQGISAKRIQERLSDLSELQELGLEPFDFTFAGVLNKVGDHVIEFKELKVKINVVIKRAGVEPQKQEQKEEEEEFEAIPEPEPKNQLEAPHSMLIGTEFTFSNAQMQKEAKEATHEGTQQQRVRENWTKQKEWARIMKQRGDVQVQEEEDKVGLPVIKVTYKDGWWYKVSLDVGVIETQTYKMSLPDAQQRGWLDRLDKDVFAVAEKLGLKPDQTFGGGHIHLDLGTTFGGSYMLFRNFLVDFTNNPLALEALENDPTNAPVIGQLKSGPNEFAQFLRHLSSQGLDKKDGTEAIVYTAGQLQKRVYKLQEELDPPEKYHALNTTRIADTGLPLKEKTLEIRALRAQRSVKEFFLVAQLFQARIAMLKQQLGELAFDKKAASARGKKHSDPTDVIKAFREYIETANLAFEDYEEMLYANLQERHKNWTPPSKQSSQESVNEQEEEKELTTSH